MFLPQLFISMILFLILFFGIGFLLNMVLRVSWLMTIIYPIIVIIITNDAKLMDYVIAPTTSFSTIGANIVSLQFADILILASGLIGTIISGIVIKMLRARGYQMF